MDDTSHLDTRHGVPILDFDLFSATTREGSDEAWRAAREQYPVAWTARNGGHWIVCGYEATATAFRDWEHFSSARTNPEYCAITFGDSRIPLLVPEEVDPPEWYALRRILAELLSPRAVEQLRPRIRRWVTHYVDEIIESGRCEFVRDITCPVPAAVTLEWLGFPASEWQAISAAFHDVAAYPKGSAEFVRAGAAFVPLMARISEELEARRRAPRDDALTAIAYHEIGGVPIANDVAEALVFNTVGGGVDTTTSLIGSALLHLCQSPEDRRRLFESPDLLSTATEEFLRCYPPARTHARTVSVDVELAGCPMRKGDRVVLSEISADRDEAAFPDAERFVIDRLPNRHLSFGVGIHRCPGSHLARIEFAETIEAILTRMPDFAIDFDDVVEYPGWSMIGGWERIPATFTPGPRTREVS
jgi:cytochrome P450